MTNLEKCPKHKNYRGLSKSKRNCPHCDKIYETVNKESIKYGKYRSISTPGLKCGVIHALAEWFTLMLHGDQPPYFWRKGTKADPKAKKYFSKIYGYLEVWHKQRPDMVKSIDTLMYNAYFKDYKRQLAHSLCRAIPQAQDDEQNKVVYDGEFDVDEPEQVSRFSKLKELANGEEENSQDI